MRAYKQPGEANVSDWREGAQLAPMKKGPITREDLVFYGHASGDFNKIHLDETFAKEAGFPSVIAHGMLSMAYLADEVRFNFPEENFKVLRLKCRFRRVTFPGDTLELGGDVKKVSENQTLTVHLWVKNQNGEITSDGEAELAPVSA